MRLRTSLDAPASSGQPITSTATLTGTEAVTATEYAYDGRVFNTIMTGRHLKDANLSTDTWGR